MPFWVPQVSNLGSSGDPRAGRLQKMTPLFSLGLCEWGLHRHVSLSSEILAVVRSMPSFSSSQPQALAGPPDLSLRSGSSELLSERHNHAPPPLRLRLSTTLRTLPDSRLQDSTGGLGAQAAPGKGRQLQFALQSCDLSEASTLPPPSPAICRLL